MKMKFVIVCYITLISLCSVSFAAKSYRDCTNLLQESFQACFRKAWYKIVSGSLPRDFKTLVSKCKAIPKCKMAAKSCMMKELEHPRFKDCAAAKTYSKSIDRLYN
ncbi:unnamed protein product [Trichobilharzia szidati]|nr:unnamed protein product [Trichobilharzia szidati]